MAMNACMTINACMTPPVCLAAGAAYIRHRPEVVRSAVKITGAVATLATIQRTLVQVQLSKALLLVTAGNAPPQDPTRVLPQAAAAPKPAVALHLLAPLGAAHPT